MEDITDSDYNAKSVCKDFRRQKKWVNIMISILKAIHYYWLMFFKKFLKICLELYQLDPSIFFISTPAVSIASSFKKG